MANFKAQEMVGNNTETSTLNDFTTAYDLDKFYDDLYKTRPANRYKALDFSNVAIYGSQGNSLDESSNDAKFRHFHQMRLFIERGTTQHHGKDFEDKTVITCNLPEQIQYALNSKWEAPLGFGDATTRLLMQVGGHAISQDLPSGTMRVSTLKVWQNTDPLTLNLTIPVIDDGNSVSGTNLVEALEILGSLALPKTGDGFAGFYIPPPSPLGVNIIYGKTQLHEAGNFYLNTANSSRIILQLGGVLLVDNCIIEAVQVNYPNTKAQIRHTYKSESFGATGQEYLHPLLATVTLRISTIEGLTSDTYSKMLWARPQAGMGKYEADVTKITDAANWVETKIKNLVGGGNSSGQDNTPQEE